MIEKLRIVSVVPSQTELLFDLGLNKEVIGITKFCIHPKSWFQNKERVGGTKQLDLDKIKQLNPTLIIANKEENEKNQIEYLQSKFNVYVSDISNLNEALEMILKIGVLTSKEIAARLLISKISSNFNKIIPIKTEKKAAYFIWRNPYMTVGNDTFIADMMELCGFENVFKHKTRYPEVTEIELKEANPQNVLLSSEPYPFKEKHIREIKEILPNSNIMLVNGEMFSWYGSRLQYSPLYFQKIIKTVS